MNLLNKKSDEAKGEEKAPKRNLKKAARFFEHAQAVTDTRNYDYAIELYAQGLALDPDNMRRHDELYEVAMRRKVGGGRPAGFSEKMKAGFGGDPITKMLNAEKIWCKDPLKPRLMLDAMRKAVAADRHYEEFNLGEVAFWIGSKILEGKQEDRNVKYSMMVELSQLFAEVGAYEQAIEAHQIATDLAPPEKRQAMEVKLRDLQAMRSIEDRMDRGDELGAQVADMGKQRDLDASDQVVQTESAMEKLIATRREEWREKPTEPDRITKFVNQLLKAEDDERDEEAIGVLQEAFEKTEQYRWKMQVGDVKIRQFNRHLRELKKENEESPSVETDKKIKQLQKKRLNFELEEFKERVTNYPTDINLRFEYGKRLLAAGQYEDAVAALQEAMGAPKYRASALLFMGQAFNGQELYDEAVDSFRKGLEANQGGEDALAKQLRYQLMDALHRKAVQDSDAEAAKEAQQIASQILQTDINYRDVKDRSKKLRSLVTKLTGAAAGGEK